MVREASLPHQGRSAELGPAHGPPTPLPRAATSGLPVPGGLGMAPDIPAATTAAPARTRAIAENRPVNQRCPLAQIAPLVRVTRSTSRSTPDHGDRRIVATERYLRRTPPRSLARFIVLLDVRGAGWHDCRVSTR